LVLKNHIIKEQYYLGTIFIYKNTLLKDTVEWHKPKKSKTHGVLDVYGNKMGLKTNTSMFVLICPTVFEI